MTWAESNLHLNGPHLKNYGIFNQQIIMGKSKHAHHKSPASHLSIRSLSRRAPEGGCILLRLALFLQFEGAYMADGKGPSIWDQYANKPMANPTHNHIFMNQTGEHHKRKTILVFCGVVNLLIDPALTQRHSTLTR